MTRLTQRIIVVTVGVSCLVPIVEVAIMIVMLASDHTRFMPEVITFLLISVPVCWFPSVAYLVYRIDKSDEAPSRKAAWITYLVTWAPLVAPIVWYKFCLHRPVQAAASDR